MAFEGWGKGSGDLERLGSDQRGLPDKLGPQDEAGLMGKFDT